MMVTERGIFNAPGSYSLTCVEWTEEHGRIVAASLVQGVYSMEVDRQENHQAPQFQPCTRSWWEVFGFELKEVICDDPTLKDNHKLSIFGAIFEYKQFASSSNNSASRNPPSYVIAFRGTLKKLKNIIRDLKSNRKIIKHSLYKDSRASAVLDAVKRIVSQAGAKNVWLAGHSLGSAIALLAGRNMFANLGFDLQTFLFNPPFPSLSIEQIIPYDYHKTKRVIGVAKNIGTAVGAVAVHNTENQFLLLSNWKPFLFVNSSDLICWGYIEYFKQRETMQTLGSIGRSIGKAATRNSGRSLISALAGKKREPIHLIPSAIMFVNNQAEGRRKAHGLAQWYKPSINLHVTSHEYK